VRCVLPLAGGVLFSILLSFSSFFVTGKVGGVRRTVARGEWCLLAAEEGACMST
jgi:hypothetical protein